jgi:hypothetical protein
MLVNVMLEQDPEPFRLPLESSPTTTGRADVYKFMFAKVILLTLESQIEGKLRRLPPAATPTFGPS